MNKPFEFKKTIDLGENKISVSEEVFKKYIGKYGATACGGWLTGECYKCIEDGITDEKIQFNCKEYRESFDFAEALANTVDK
jgi:hypothetical protein